MVQRLSAQLYLPKECRYPVHSSHADMVKFNSPRNKAFQTVVTIMEEGIGKQLERFLLPGSGVYDGSAVPIRAVRRGEYL